MILHALAFASLAWTLYILRRVELQGRRNRDAIVALALEVGTPEAMQAAWLLVPEKKRPKP